MTVRRTARGNTRTHRARCALGAAALAAALLTGGCAADAAGPATAPSAAGAGYPVTVNNCGADYTYRAAPGRIVTTSLPATELVLALGLGDRLVGTVPANGTELPEYRDALAKAPKIAQRAWPAPGREAVLGANPDIVISGYLDDYGKEALGDRADLAGKGLNSYLLQGACGKAPARAEDILSDVDSLGRVFGIPDRAAALRQRLVDQIGEPAPVAADPPTVFVYEGQEDKPLTDGRDALVNDLITRAGGKTVFPDQAGFGEVSWEEVVARDPDVIVIVAQGDFLNPEKAKKFLTSYPPLRGVTAVKHQRFVVVGVTDLQPGVRVGAALQALRAGLAR
ncbi:MAG TPA: ABC transporter substrate-binding protein [Pilimelia sp.]|nr:ABC transporter substrate-binding protein [Pilimelia sp.]